MMTKKTLRPDVLTFDVGAGVACGGGGAFCLLSPVS
jgi:hypothetical protein